MTKEEIKNIANDFLYEDQFLSHCVNYEIVLPEMDIIEKIELFVSICDRWLDPRKGSYNHAKWFVCDLTSSMQKNSRFILSYSPDANVHCTGCNFMRYLVEKVFGNNVNCCLNRFKKTITCDSFGKSMGFTEYQIDIDSMREFINSQD